MNAKVEIKGDVGVAVNAEDGAAIHFHVQTATTESQLDLVGRAVRTLLNTCDEINCKDEMYKISQTLFGTSFFKNLNLEQLTKLQVIAEEMRSALKRKAPKDESHAVFTQEVNEYEEFYRRIGIRASKLERVALTELMPLFNPRQIKTAWSNGILFYENNQLRIKLPTLEPWLGAVLALVSGLELYLITMQILLVKPPVQHLVQQTPTFLMFVAALFGSARYMIAPAYIGKRIKAVLEKP
jgi:hypothetical protein